MASCSVNGSGCPHGIQADIKSKQKNKSEHFTLYISIHYKTFKTIYIQGDDSIKKWLDAVKFQNG